MPFKIFHIIRLTLHIVFYLCVPLCLFAQEVVHTQTEAEALNEQLRELEGIRLDINRASTQQLLTLPYLSPELCNNIISNRPYRHIKDLKRVKGITNNLYDLITPYLSATSTHPWQSAITLRITRPANHSNDLQNLRIYQRLQISARNISGFFLTERDPKEPHLTDHLTGYLKIPIQNATLTLGDIRPHWGQGLIFSRRTRPTTGLSGARPYTTTRSGNRTSTEHGALRGIHLRRSHHYFTFTGLWGHTSWDAKLTPENPPRIYTTGLHHTQSAQQRKRTLSERLIATHLQLGTKQKHLGISVANTTFTPQTPAKHKPWLWSINGQWRTEQASFFGEITPKAYLGGLTAGTSKLRLHILTRRYNTHFYSLHGAPFATYGTPANNEWGTFFGLTWRWTSRTRLELSLDRYGRLTGTLPPRGEKLRLNLHHRLATRLYTRLTADSKRTTGQPNRRSLRFSTSYRHAIYRLILWAQHTRSVSSGKAIGFRLTLGNTKGFSTAIWVTHHKVSNNAARIYDFEPDVWGGTRLLTLSKQGTNRGVRISWATRYFRIATRYSQHRASSWALQIDLRR